MSKRTRASGKVLAARVLSGVVAVVLALGVAEVAFRALWLKRLTVGSGLDDPRFHHRPKPYETYHYTSEEFDVTIRTNRFGLRGPDPVLPKPPGRMRILMLGDSYTFGFPVRDEETFSHLIEAGLRERGYNVDVINGGVSGYSSTLEYLSLRDQFLAFEPDLVILWFDLGDVQEDAWYQKNLLYDEAGRIVRCDPRYVNGRFAWWEWSKEHLALAKYLDTRVVRTVQKLQVLGFARYLQIAMRGQRAKNVIAQLKAQERTERIGEYERFLLVRDWATEEIVAPAWATTTGYLARIHELLRERSIPFMIGLYPYGMLVGPQQWAEGRTYWDFERGRTYDATLMLSLFERWAAEQEVPLINTFGRFREAAAREKLFYDWDGHFTPAGHHVAATAVMWHPVFRRVLDQFESRR